MPRVVLAFDKFRGTATADELVAAGGRAASAAGWSSTAVPLGDGGEGSLDVLGGANRRTTVTGPLGDPVEAAWRLANSPEGKVAFIEMAAASGLVVAGGSELNDPLAADTTGTGELIMAAVEAGAKTVVVLLGGSATTDGGFGAVRAVNAARLRGIELVVACDVATRFVDAASVFGPQKGATPAQVALLTRRLERLVQLYRDDYGVDLSQIAGAGAAGGLAGGLVALGATVRSGFDVLAEHAALDEALDGADLVITGEGKLDAESFNGKVVGGVASWAAEQDVPVLAMVGIVDPSADGVVPNGVTVRSLAAAHGAEAAMARTVELVEGELLAALTDR
ncbi:MAG: glycerate kinase family protein [Acidimicrobiales bacterium]